MKTSNSFGAFISCKKYLSSSTSFVINEIAVGNILQGGAASNRGQPSEEFERRLEDSHQHTLRPRTTILSV